MKLGDFTLGTKALEKFNSSINGEIEVIKSLAWGTYVQIGGLTQSGGVISDVWKTTLKKVASSKKHVDRALILGLGAGSAARFVRKFWPEAKITGVEIDPIMVEIGNKYFDLEKLGVDTIVGDAEDFVEKAVNDGKTYNLILNDMYVGDEVPKKFERDEYIDLVRRQLSRSGVAVFNRLYYGTKRKQAVKFREKLEKHFGQVDAVYPEANLMYVCRK